MAILRACRTSRYILPFVGGFLQPVRRLSTSAAAIRNQAVQAALMQSSCAQQLHPNVMSSPYRLSRRLISLGLCSFVMLSSILSLISIL